MHRIPQVSEGTLRLPGPLTAPIEVGSTSWVSWLADPGTRSFSFRGYGGNFTARKELRSRGGEYWVAYRRRGGKLHKTYVGKAEDLTLTRLQDAAAVLAGGDGETVASPPPDATTDDAETAHVAGAEKDDSATANRRSHRGDSLLVTKLSVPSARRSLVARPRLGERLDEGLGRKLTLLSAPAGFGKTTLLSAWIGGLSDGGRPVAWFSLDPGDNDPARFWRYFITAVDQLQPGSGKTALALLDSPRAPPIESILTSVLNELAGLEVDAVLVLDDYHLIEHRTIHEDLTFLLEHLPPRLRLMIATRADPPLPLSRLRAGGEMDELRAADLRFTPEEAATFLNRVMGLELAAEDIAELEERTEGWIAGLQLAALAMRDHADVPGFIAAFTGSNRFVVDYLAEEVLQQQPEALRTFLSEHPFSTGCAPLCARR